MRAPEAIADYFEQLTEERRAALKMVRKAVLRIWPSLEEELKGAMLTYSLHGNMLLQLADRKNYMAMYIGPHDLLHAFKSDLRVYDHGRSCIRFKRLDAALMDLIERMIRYTGDQMHTSKFYKPQEVEVSIV